jgi:hypothetical protein
MAITLDTVTNPAVPNLLLAPNEYQRQYTDQLNNVLRLYFNQLNTTSGTQITNATILQDEINVINLEIDALSLESQRNQTLIWLGM